VGEVLRADAVVIGSGAGGAPAALALAESGRRVVVLEAGPRVETSGFTGREGEMLARLFVNTAVEGSGQSLYAGACVGGSTVVNDALCWRTPPEVLAAWRDAHGLSGLRDEAFAPFIERAWAEVSASPTDRAHTNRNAWRLAQGAERLGWRHEAIPRNVRGCANLGLCNFGCPSGAKQSALVGWIPRAEAAGARVLAGTRAERVELEAGAVRAVAARRADGAPLRIETPLVLAAAGVLDTPALLLRSALARPGVGAGLQLHSTLYVAARFAEPVHGYYGPTMAWGVTEFADVLGRGGVGFMLENTAVHPVATALALPGFGADHERAMAALPHLARCVVLLRDATRGRIALGDDGRARLHYDLVARDLARLREGVAAAARLYLAAGAEEVHLPLHGAPPVRSEADVAAALPRALDPPRLASLYAVHLFGGAPMGASPETGACDETGAVFGARGLYVCDASALPSNTGVNPQITIMANALRVAAGIAA
jgi:choline dehydrogenase-like flavoprotein